MVKYRVSADQSHMVVSVIEIRCYLDFSADELLAFNWSQAQIYVFQSCGSPLKLSIDLKISLQWY